jgi:hypothetical protein
MKADLPVLPKGYTWSPFSFSSMSLEMIETCIIFELNISKIVELPDIKQLITIIVEKHPFKFAILIYFGHV